MNRLARRTAACAAALVTALPCSLANATIVEFQTVSGSFEVNLYDNATPQTVANFLDYVNNGSYTSSVFHRSVAGFVVQGGGFTFELALPLDAVPQNAPVPNEPVFSNVRGTIAMAKLAGNPDSATSQWFFNLADNSANLDGQNGGFTVFGEVVGNGMDVVDAIAGLPTFDFGGGFGELPLRSYTATDFANGVSPDATHLVIIDAIVVSDSTVDSAAGLNPPLNAPPPAPPPTAGGGGGSSQPAFLLTLMWMLGRRRWSRREISQRVSQGR